MNPAASEAHSALKGALFPDERRVTVRYLAELEALSRSLELPESIYWGAKVQDLSLRGLGLLICFPFKTGAYLAVDLRCAQKVSTLLVRVVHVNDQKDGTWILGCEFVKSLSKEELQKLLV